MPSSVSGAPHAPSGDAAPASPDTIPPEAPGELDPESGSTPRKFPVLLDPPAETTRMALIFLTCLLFSIAGLVLASRAKADSGVERTKGKLLAAAIALSGGLFTIGLISSRYRPGGAHARRIVLELTHDEVRLWGRGYGTRVGYRDVVRVRYRLVDAYLGRLGAMRQLRIGIEGAGRSIEVASDALVDDLARGLTAEGGEGDCIVLDRDDFDHFERALLARVPQGVVTPEGAAARAS